MMNTSKENYPIKCFYNDKANQFYVFYREGESFIIQSDISKFFFDKITDKDLGQAFLFDNKSIIARSSSYTLFFKLEWDQYIN